MRAAIRRWWFESTNAISTAGGMNSTSAPSPIASSNGVARAGARKKPTLPPAANRLMAVALLSAATRASRPAGGWNIATPNPDTSSSANTAGYDETTPVRPTPIAARIRPSGAISRTRRRSASRPIASCGTALPNVAASARPEAAE